MDASALDQKITLETPQTGEDELGQTDLVWNAPSAVWAKVMETPGREFLAGDYQAEEKVVFIIRWKAVDSTARVTWNSRVYRINSVTGTHREGWAYLHCVSTEGPN